MLDRRWRAGVERCLRPLAVRLQQAGVSADQVTLSGLAASVATAVAIANGRLVLGAVLLVLAGLTDMLDGAVAKSGGTTGPRGAFFDSVADRMSDAVVLGGIAWYLAGRDPHLSLLAFTVAALSYLVSYERARAESLGLAGKGGLMERAERMVVLFFGLLLGALVPALWVLTVLTGVTVGQRFVNVWRQTGAAEARRPAWWLTTRPARTDDDFRLDRWRWVARPPGERERSRLARWLLTSRPPRSETGTGTERRWWESPPGRSDAGVRSQLRRLRGRTRP